MSGSQGESALRRIADRAVRFGAPLGVLAIVLAVFVGERARIDHELHLVIAQVAAPGERIALRAFLFDRLEMPDGPGLASAPVGVRVLDRAGRVRVRTTLAASPAGGAEGELTLPADLDGWIDVEAIAYADFDPVASVHTALEVRSDAPAHPLLDREATALQRLDPGVAEGPWPAPFELRVAGGACVPEATCELLVHAGEPPTAFRLEATPSATPAAPRELADATGLVRIPLVVHGPEARVELVASREGVEVARRMVQLPVALATPALDPGPRLLASGARPRLAVQVLGDRPGVIVDAYRHGRWAHTASFAPSDEPVPLPYPLTPGVWRLQVRTDPFGSERAAMRLVVVRRPGEPAEAALERALGELAATEDVSAPPGPPELRFAWVAAAMEERGHLLPEPVSGRGEDLARLASRRALLRGAAVIAMILGLLVATVLFVRRGLEAALEAQRVMEATGDRELASPRHARRTLLSALALVGALLLALVGGAALIVVRAHLFE